MIAAPLARARAVWRAPGLVAGQLRGQIPRPARERVLPRREPLPIEECLRMLHGQELAGGGWPGEEPEHREKRHQGEHGRGPHGSLRRGARHLVLGGS